MSEFLAEALVLIRPDTTKFRAELLAQLNAIKIAPISVPIVAAGAGLAAAATVTSALSAAQKQAETSALGLASTTTVLNRAEAQGIPLLQARAVATEQLAGAEVAADAARKRGIASLLGAGTATSKLDAALLGLRTALGSTAVIGLGALSLAAIVTGKAVAASIKNFAAFQQELATFRVTAGASADEMERVSEQATLLGDDVRLPAVSAADAAVAMTELAKAGLTVEDAMAGARGVLELATAAQISNADAAKIAANALNSFGLAGDQATRVADDFANAANAAQGSIADVGLALQQSSAVARQVGLSLEDTVSILSLFAKSGLQGSDAGTSLRVALIRLVAPTKVAAAEIQKLGLQIRDVQGNVRADVFAQFGEATKNLTPAARDAAAALIFGQDAIRAVAIGAREGTEGLRLMQFQIDQTGTAAEVSAARTEGLAGAFSALSSTAQTLSIEFGKIISLGLTPYVQAVTIAFTATNKFVTALDGLATAALNVQTPLGKIKDRMFDIASVGVPIVGEVRLIRAGIDRLGIGSDANAEKIKDLNTELQNLQKARVAVELGGDPVAADELTKRIQRLKQAIADLKLEAKGIDIGGTIGQQIQNLQRAIDLLENTSGSSAAIARLRTEIENLRSGLQATGAPVRDFSSDVGHLGQQSSAAATGVDALTKALGDLGRQSAQTDAELLKLQSEGGSPQQQVGVLQSDIATQRQIIEEQKKRGGAAGSATAIKKAREKIIQDQNEIESLQSGIESDAKAAASEAEASAKKVQGARDKQFKALAESFGGRQDALETALDRAGVKGNLAKEIKLNQTLIASFKKELEVLRARLKNLKVSAEVRKQILGAIISALNQAKTEQLRLQQEQQQAIADTLTERLDLRIQLAEATGNVAAQLKAHRAKLEEITKELVRARRQFGRNSNEWLRLKVAQQEEVKRIKELQGAAEDKKDATKSLFFTFLQTQQGFAANLLGNLIPGFATGGLVGGSSAPGEGLRQVAGGFEQPRGGVEGAAAVASSRERGVRPIQVDTTNQLLRAILRSLQNLNGRASHPEARYQNRVAGSNMDTIGGV